MATTKKRPRNRATAPHLTTADWRTVRAAVTYLAEWTDKYEITVDLPKPPQLWRVVDKLEEK